jgi:predicted enzyme related to lactoylglutathione lyase
MPKMPVKDMGYIRIYIDSENNMFGLFEEKK